uniref:Uncharacterized protein n=1 Tax=Esox lucius TaxID=8010 RepID=A0AAY5L4Y5_ESOLU
GKMDWHANISKQTQQCRQCTSALVHSVWHSSSGRVNHGNEANKAQILCRKVNFFAVKGKAVCKLVIREMGMVEVEPRVSTASRFFTRQFFLAMRLAVRVRHT